jgi:hypothetical protein
LPIASDRTEEKMSRSVVITVAWGRMSKLGLVAALALSAGCAIHTQGPVKEVAYDFSDYHYYDRNYAPSPEYADRNDYGLLAELPASQSGAPAALGAGEKLPSHLAAPTSVIDPAAQ